MKKRSIILTVLTAFIAVSCDIDSIKPSNKDLYQYNFTLSSADATKAIISGESIRWENNDNLGVICVNGDNNSHQASSISVEDGHSTMAITSNIPLTTSSSIYCYYPFNRSNVSDDATSITLSIPTVQLSGNGIYDADAMPMASIPFSLEESIDATNNYPVDAGVIKMCNLGSVIEFNVYSSEYSNETIRSIVFNSDDSAIAGDFSFDLTSVDYDSQSTLEITGLTEKSVKTSTSVAVAATKADANPVYMVIAPGSYTGSIVINTNAASYTFNITSAKEYVRSGIKHMGVNLNNATREIREEILVTDVITAADLAATSTTYSDFSNVKYNTAVYSGNSAKNNDGNIQIRTKNSNSGIVTTTSGGIVKSITIEVVDGSIDVYGNNTPYSSASELYATAGNSNQGTLIGALASTGTIVPDSEYQYIGIRSHDGAAYVASISVIWDAESSPEVLTSYEIDFESNDLETYSDWKFTNIECSTGAIDAHSGTYYGTTSQKSTASIETKTKIASPNHLSFFISKTSTNTTASDWKVQYSNDKSSWNDISTHDAKSMSKGLWAKVDVDLSEYANSYFRIHYSGSTAVRAIDDIVLSTVPQEIISVTGISIDNTSAEITAGNNIQLAAIIEPSTATNQNVIWTSTDESIATVEDGLVTAIAAGTATITVTTEDGSKTASCDVTVINQTAQNTILDLTTKAYGNSAYNSELAYGDWKIVNGANNNKGWAYFKMGGKNTTISSKNPCYIYNTTAISHKVEQITVSIAAGSLSKSGMSVNNWGVYVYSDAKMTNQIDYVSGGTITNSAGLFTFTPSNNVSWNAGDYYKISWDLANTTSTNGIVCVDKITLSSVAE